MTNWQPLHGVDPRRLREARVQAHYATQWLARIARAFVPPQPDDGHTSLIWTEALGGMVTQPMTDGSRVGLDIRKLTFLLVEPRTGMPVLSLPLNGRSDTEAREWVGQKLTARGLDPHALDGPSPYELPPHPIAEGGTYDAEENTDGLTELRFWFANAAISLVPIRQRMSDRQFTASPLRCWPHHFDLATLISFPVKAPNTTAYIGVGLDPGDDYYDEPYFYVTLHPRPDESALPRLPTIGHWHTKNFVGAIAPATKILATKEPQAETELLLQTAIDTAINLLR